MPYSVYWCHFLFGVFKRAVQGPKIHATNPDWPTILKKTLVAFSTFSYHTWLRSCSQMAIIFLCLTRLPVWSAVSAVCNGVFTLLISHDTAELAVLQLIKVSWEEWVSSWLFHPSILDQCFALIRCMQEHRVLLSPKILLSNGECMGFVGLVRVVWCISCKISWAQSLFSAQAKHLCFLVLV